MATPDTLKVLFVEHSANAVDELVGVLRRVAYLVEHRQVGDPTDLEDALEGDPCDLVLFAAGARRCSLPEVRARIDVLEPGLPIIAVYSDRVTEPALRVNELLEAGATDAVAKGNRTHFQFVVARELVNLEERRLRARCQSALKERERRWLSLLESSRDPVAYVHGGMHVHANKSYLEMFGFDRSDELERVPLMDLVSPEDQDLLREALRGLGDIVDHVSGIELKGLRLDGNALEFKMELSAVTFENEACWQVVIRDRSGDRDIHDQLEYLKTRDPVTGLHNRQFFLDRLKEVMADREAAAGTLYYIELDNFNTLKERIGIAAADEVMAGVGSAFQHYLPPDHLLARFGDGVYTVLGRGGADDDVEAIAVSIRGAIEAHFVETEGQTISTTCSIGAARFEPGQRSTQSIVRKAQQACREARCAARSRIRVKRQLVSGEMLVRRESAIARTVESALDAGRASLAYQPIFGINDESARMYEVFLRVVDEAGHPLPPAEIFSDDISEALAARLDRWVIARTIAQLRDRAQDDRQAKFFVNLSGQAMLDESLLIHVAGLLREAGTPADGLVIEIGEALTVTQSRSVKAFITGLRELGCHAALEHFGAGLSSVNTLRHIPVEYIKIDSSLVSRVASDDESEAAIRAIVEIARSLNRSTIAFGVEDTATLAKLWMVGIDYVQGNGVQTASEELEWNFEATKVV